VAEKLAKYKGDLEGLQKLAAANGVWDDKYSKLNPGQLRMIIGNKLRKLDKVKWGR
jgi:hypothetical protein